ncbi:MAG: hypothetical protein MNSN_03660 [Minisyncoccus archaeiphilus]|nr:MAG: hypothetical protein MNSN_03660 [Candidatus Parcubacteria bacterium]
MSSFYFEQDNRFDNFAICIMINTCSLRLSS